MPTDPAAPLTPDEIEQIYRTLIQPTLFGGFSGGQSPPKLVLLGGQPGSGKSRASARLFADHDGMVALSGDDLRIFHPQYRELISSQPERAGAVLADATRTWVRAAIQEALDGRRSLLLEGTFGDPDVTLATAARFREAGFVTRIVVIASPRVLSVVTVASRYLRDHKANTPARFTRLSAHDRGYEGTTRLVASLDASTPVEQVTIVSRNGRILFDRTRDSKGDSDPFADARTALNEGRYPASWGARSAMELLGELKQITAYAIASGELTPESAQLLVHAHTLALDDLVPRLSVDSDSPQAKFIQQAVSEQLVALRRASLPADTPAPDLPPAPDAHTQFEVE